MRPTDRLVPPGLGHELGTGRALANVRADDSPSSSGRSHRSTRSPPGWPLAPRTDARRDARCHARRSRSGPGSDGARYGAAEPRPDGREGRAACSIGSSRARSRRSCGSATGSTSKAGSTSPVRVRSILAANHRSFLDSIFLPLVVRRRVTFVAKAEYFDDPEDRVVLPGRRPDPDPPRGWQRERTRARRRRWKCSHDGGVFGIYPEGTRTRDGYLHRGHTGVARLSLRSGAPIVPVGLIGTDEVQPVDKKMPRLFRPVTDPLRRGARPGALRRSCDTTTWRCASSPTR